MICPHKSGFTFIELIVVVAIVGILSVTAISQYQTYVARSQVTRVIAESGAIKTALEVCVLAGLIAEGVCDVQASPSNIQSALPIVKMPKKKDDSTVIVATFGRNAATTLTNMNVVWRRDPKGAWSCTTTVEAKYAPAGCPSYKVL